MLRSIVNYLSYIPKRFVAILAIVALVMPMFALAGWAPDRPVKDYNNLTDRQGFDHPVFNSFINTPSYGDERAFYDGKDATNTNAGGFQTEMNVSDGQEIHLRIYIHNNANQSLNASGQGVAKNSKVRILMPTGTERALRSIAYISASNATPETVSDTMDFVNEVPFSLEYIPGSARAHSRGVPNGYQVADSIVNGGAPVGYNGPDGTIPGCFEFDTVVTVRAKVREADFTVQKQVRKLGETEWKDSITANPGDTLEYVIAASNKSKTTLKNVVVGDKLPQHITYLPGTSILRNGNFPNGVAVGNDKVVNGGIDIGSYLPNAVGYVRFQAKVASIEQLPCGTTTLSNVGVVQPEQMADKRDNADATVTKQCQTTPPSVTPAQSLPVTGPETAAFAAMGSAGLGVGIRSYLRSRRGLLDALLNQ